MALADTTAPVLTSLTLPGAVDVTTGGTTVTFSAGATDQGAGVDYVAIVFRNGWQDDFGVNSVVSIYDADDSYADGSSSQQAFIGNLSESGTYGISGVLLYDKAGNNSHYDASQLAGMGFRTSFTIAASQQADTTAPLLTSLTLPDTVDLTTGGTTVTFSAGATDQGMGVERVTIVFRTGWQDGADIDSVVSIYGSDDSYGNGSSSQQAFISDLSQAGTYEISGVLVYDKAGNYSHYDTSQLAGMGIQTSFTIAGNGQTGTAGDDTLTGTAFADDLSGGTGNDTLRGMAGDDRIDGGEGIDTAVFSGTYRQSHIVVQDGVITVTGPDGVDTLTGVERLSFVDGILSFDAQSTGAQVQRLYDTVLGRRPDAPGLDFWVDRIEDQGVSLAAVADALAGSAEFQAATGGLGNAAFVDYVYAHALGRAADSGGLAYWADRLDRGLSRGAMLAQFSESAEHQDRTAAMVAEGYFQSDDTAQAIALLYDSFSGRRPDADGLAFWTDRVTSGTMTLAQVADQFTASAEFTQATRTLSNGELVDLMYRNTLDRAPDAGGRAYWAGRLDHGMSQGALLLEFSQSPEHAGLMAAYVTGGISLF